MHFLNNPDYFYSKVAVEGMLLFIMSFKAIGSQLAVTQIAELDGNRHPFYMTRSRSTSLGMKRQYLVALDGHLPVDDHEIVTNLG